MNILSKYLLLLVLLIILSVDVYGQFHAQRTRPLKANSHLQLGDLELDFNSNPNEVRKTFEVFDILYRGVNFGAPYLFYNISLQTDKLANFLPVSHPTTGELRFLISSRGLYGKDLQLAPNGELNITLPSTNFERAIVTAPIFNDDDRYYLFGLSSSEDNLQLVSSIINTNLNGGKGDFEQSSKNIPFATLPADAFTEIIDIVPGNNCDYWLVIAQNLSTQFRIIAFNVSENGINPSPSVSSFNKTNINSTYWDMQISPARNLISYVTSDFSETNIGFLNFNVENGYASESEMPNINVIENSISTRTTFTPDNTHLIVYSNVHNNGEALFYKYDLRAYRNEYRKSSFTFPFKYRAFDNGLHGKYIPPLISFKTYNQTLYFNIPQSVQTVDPFDPEVMVVTIKGAATSIVPLLSRANDWNDMEIGKEIPLSNLCRLFNNNNIVYPYTEIDTIPNVYLDSVICLNPNSSFPATILQAKDGFENYVWNDGTSGPSQIITTPGKYWVHYKGDCNSRVDTFNISLWKPDVMLGSDTVICEQRFPINLAAGTTSQYLWDDNSTDRKRWIQEPGKYWVQFENFGCVQRDSIVITSKYCPCDINLPNAFSPNGDGNNDYFKPIIALGCVPQGYSFRIFNRWGQMVYSSFDEFDKGWDGNKNGLPADPGNYIYELRFKSRFLDDDYYAKGDLTLVR